MLNLIHLEEALEKFYEKYISEGVIGDILDPIGQAFSDFNKIAKKGEAIMKREQKQQRAQAERNAKAVEALNKHKLPDH